MNGTFKLQVLRANQIAKAGANPYGSIGCFAGSSTETSVANKTQVLGSTNKHSASHPDAQNTEAGKEKASSHPISEKHNISYKTSQSVVRMPG